jgi:hypothetical protein
MLSYWIQGRESPLQLWYLERLRRLVPGSRIPSV